MLSLPVSMFLTLICPNFNNPAQIITVMTKDGRIVRVPGNMIVRAQVVDHIGSCWRSMVDCSLLVSADICSGPAFIPFHAIMGGAEAMHWRFFLSRCNKRP